MNTQSYAPNSAGSRLLAAETPSGRQHFTLDHLGSLRLVTGEGGETLSRHVYYPYGEEITVGSEERLKFTGHERDLGGPGTADDLDYMHARYYQPGLGRFLSVDPARSWKRRLPQSWNMYTYALNSPMKYLDPDGREARLGAGSDRILNIVHLAVPADVRDAITVGTNRKGQKILMVDNSVRSDSLNYNNFRRVVNSPGVVEINVGNEFSFERGNGDVVSSSLEEIDQKGVTIPSDGTRGENGTLSSTRRGITEVHVQENLSDVELAPVVAAEVAGHALPGLLGDGALPASQAEHLERESPATAEARENRNQDDLDENEPK